MPKKSKSKTKPEEKKIDKKLEPKVKEIKPEAKHDEEESIEFNEDFAEEILTAESRGRAMPILMSGQIQEKPIASLEEFAESLPSSANDSEKDDKGYANKTKYGAESYTGAKNYEATDKKDYETSASFVPERRPSEAERSPFTTPTAQPSSTREQESKESLEKFSQQQQYATQRDQEQNEPAFRHKEKRE